MSQAVAAIIKAMKGAKLGAEAILAAIESHLADEAAQAVERRAKDAARKRDERAGAKRPLDIADNSDAVDIQDSVDAQDISDEPSPEVPPKNNIKPLPTPNQSSLRSETSRAEAGSIFDAEFWPAYPRRDGSNPKEAAKTKFVQHVAKGVDPAEIVAGAKAYAAFVANDDPRFTAQAVTWLNQRRWRDEYGERAQAPPKPKRETFVDAAEWFLKGTEDGDRSRGEESPPDALELSPDEWSRA